METRQARVLQKGVSMKKRAVFLFTLALLCIGMIGCSSARSRHDPEVVRNVPHPAFSLALQQPDIIVAVSPVRQTMQIGGNIPMLLGAGISAVQDDKYGLRVREALGDYDPCVVLLDRMKQRIAQGFHQDLQQVAPQGTAAGFANMREAQEARLEGLRSSGYDTVLDLELRFGIYGPQGILVVKAAGELFDVQTGRLLWRNEVASYSVELLADMKWRDPMQRMKSSITALRFSAEDDAISQWLPENAAPLRAAFEKAVDAVSAAILTDLGLQETPEGLYALGAYLLLDKEFEAAEEKFTRAIELAPNMAEAMNGLAVTLANTQRVEEAIALAEKLVDAHPDYAPGQYNLALWQALENEDTASIFPQYEKALNFGASILKIAIRASI